VDRPDIEWGGMDGRTICVSRGGVGRSRMCVRLGWLTWLVTVWLRSLVIEGLRSHAVGASLYFDVGVDMASSGWLAGPSTMLLVHSVANTVGLAIRLRALMGGFLAGNREPDTTTNQWAVVGVGRGSTGVAVDVTEIIPDGARRWLQMILDLHKTGWSNLVVR
jgi:hypothetical protein